MFLANLPSAITFVIPLSIKTSQRWEIWYPIITQTIDELPSLQITTSPILNAGI
jgi:hypothetical protein